MDKKIKKLLEDTKTSYQILSHRTVYTAFNQAETQHLDPKAVVKTVYVKFSKAVPLSENLESCDSCLVAVPAKLRVDFKKIAAAINTLSQKYYKLTVKQNPKTKKPAAIRASMASEKDILKKLKTKVGLLSPFGPLYGLPVLVDKKLLKHKKLALSAGSYTESLLLSSKNFLALSGGIQGSFT